MAWAVFLVTGFEGALAGGVLLVDWLTGAALFFGALAFTAVLTAVFTGFLAGATLTEVLAAVLVFGLAQTTFFAVALAAALTFTLLTVFAVVFVAVFAVCFAADLVFLVVAIKFEEIKKRMLERAPVNL